MQSRYLAVILFITLHICSTVHADNTYMDTVLDALSDKGLLTQTEVDSIKARAREAERQHTSQHIQEQRIPAQQTEAQPQNGTVSTQKTVLAAIKQRIASPELPAFKVWGRLQPRYTYIAAEKGLEGTNSFTLRRARMGLKGYVADKIAFRTQYEAANQVPGLANAENLLDAWVRFEHLDDSIGTITIGQQFVPAYTRPPQWGASVERKFSEYLSPGAAGRARGISLRRGDLGKPEVSSQGLFGNRLHYGLGIFNAPDLSLNNDNNEMLYAVALGLRPTGVSPFPDEYQLSDRGATYGIGVSYAQSNDSSTLDTSVQTVDMDNEWFGVFGDVQYHHWFGWGSWTQFVSESSQGLLINTAGQATEELDSYALTLGLSRTFPLKGDTGWALGFQYQSVDNEHPSRTRFLRTLTGRSDDEVARGMDKGEAYHFMLTWILGSNVRLLNEFIIYDVDKNLSPGQFDHEAFVSQLQIDF